MLIPFRRQSAMYIDPVHEAEVYLAYKKTEAAVDTLRSALRAAPNQPDVWFALATIDPTYVCSDPSWTVLQAASKAALVDLAGLPGFCDASPQGCWKTGAVFNTTRGEVISHCAAGLRLDRLKPPTEAYTQPMLTFSTVEAIRKFVNAIKSAIVVRS